MTYWSEPNIAGRMQVIDFQHNLLRKADDATGEGGQLANMPAQVTPPAPLTPPPSAEMSGGPTLQEMDALTNSPKVYSSTEEMCSDLEQRLSEMAIDITAHVGTIGQTRYGDNLDDMPVEVHQELLQSFRDAIEQLRKGVGAVRNMDAGMTNHPIGGDEMGGLPPELMEMMGGGLQNMPAPGPAGMPPSGAPSPGPMGGMPPGMGAM
tara:strand:+ start:350 stop:970 length:621 start_codon:yes stop_codon:yes gene_type:complete